MVSVTKKATKTNQEKKIPKDYEWAKKKLLNKITKNIIRSKIYWCKPCDDEGLAIFGAIDIDKNPIVYKKYLKLLKIKTSNCTSYLNSGLHSCISKDSQSIRHQRVFRKILFYLVYHLDRNISKTNFIRFRWKRHQVILLIYHTIKKRKS